MKMKVIKLNKMAMLAAIVCLPFLFFSCKKDNPEKPASNINYHFATLAEGQQLLAANDDVPIDALDTYYTIDEASDFWDVVGRNTDYVIAPEECLADNFGFTLAYGFDGMDYQTPGLIADIYDALRNYR